MKTSIILACIILFSACTYKKDKTGENNLTTTNTSELVIFKNRSSLLKCLNENNQIESYGSPTYRFIYAAPADTPVLFRLVKHENTFALTTKMFESNSDIPTSYRLLNVRESFLTERDAFLIEKCINDCMFWNLKSDDYQCRLGATYWDVEGFRSNSLGYTHVALTRRKSGPLKDIFNILVKRSGINLKDKE